MRIIRFNITFALLVKGIVLLLGALSLAGMWAAVFADVGVTILAVLNSARILKQKNLIWRHKLARCKAGMSTICSAPLFCPQNWSNWIYSTRNLPSPGKHAKIIHAKTNAKRPVKHPDFTQTTSEVAACLPFTFLSLTHRRSVINLTSLPPI